MRPLVRPGGEISRESSPRLVPRHHHLAPYAAVVLRGSYVEAGDRGRYRVEAGDVLLHDRFEAHRDAFGAAGADILNLPCPEGIGPACGRIADPDRIVRVAERDGLVRRQGPQREAPEQLARQPHDRGHARRAAHEQHLVDLARGLVRVTERALDRRHHAIEVQARPRLSAQEPPQLALVDGLGACCAQQSSVTPHPLGEHHAGRFPLWLSPVQAVVATIVSDADDYANGVVEKLKAAGLRVEADLRNEKINYKVREHSLAKVPLLLVVGKREAEEGTLAIRRLGSDEHQKVMSLDDALAMIAEEAVPPDLRQGA